MSTFQKLQTISLRIDNFVLDNHLLIQSVSRIKRFGKAWCIGIICRLIDNSNLFCGLLHFDLKLYSQFGFTELPKTNRVEWPLGLCEKLYRISPSFRISLAETIQHKHNPKKDHYKRKVVTATSSNASVILGAATKIISLTPLEMVSLLIMFLLLTCEEDRKKLHPKLNKLLDKVVKS